MPRDLTTSSQPTPRRATVAALVLVAAAAGALPTRPALAQQQAEATLPDNLRRSDNPASQQAAINAFVAAQVEKFQAGDPAEVAEAAAALTGATAGASAPFLEAYGRAVAEGTAGLFGGNNATPAPMPARLAVAVTLDAVANTSPGPRLLEPTQRLLGDPHPGVALWGIGMVRPLAIVSVRQNLPDQDPLINALVAAVKAHPDEGHVAHAAYEVLRDLGGAGFGRGGSVALPSANVPQVIRATLDLVEFRLAEYGPPSAGEALAQTPADPVAERPATQLLASGNLFAGLDAETKTRVRRALRGLAAGSGEAAARAAEALAGQAEPAERDRYLRVRDENRAMLVAAAQAFQLIASNNFDAKPAVAAAAGQLAGLQRGANGQLLRDNTAALLEAIDAAYPELAPAEASAQAPAAE